MGLTSTNIDLYTFRSLGMRLGCVTYALNQATNVINLWD